MYLKCYIAMLPILQAEEALNQVTIARVSHGLLEKAEQTRILNGWKAQTGRKRQQLSKNQAEMMLAQMGIKVIAPKRKDDG